MMGRKYIIMLITLACTIVIFAQEDKQREKKATGWYMDVDAGTQVFFGCDASVLEFNKRITPVLSLSAGKWLTPIWGLRLQTSGWSLNGFNAGQGLYVNDVTDNLSVFGTNDPIRNYVTVRPDGSYRYYLRYMNLHADFRVSLVNLLSHKSVHKWDLVPAVGIGCLQTFAYKGTSALATLSAHFSVAGKWKLPKGFDVNLEAFAELLPDRFDGRITTSSYEPICGVKLGLTYNFSRLNEPKKQLFESVSQSDEQTGLLKDIRCIVAEEMEKQMKRNIVKDTVVVLNSVEKVTPQTKVNFMRDVRIASIRFGVGDIKPVPGQGMMFENIADFARRNPEVSLLLEGYADNKTGSREHNWNLSVKRADTVRNLLIDEYHIPAEQIKVNVYGSDVQVYTTKSAWNRVVIVKVCENQ